MPKTELTYEQTIVSTRIHVPKGQREYISARIPLPLPEDSRRTALGYVRVVMKTLQALLERLDDAEEA